MITRRELKELQSLVKVPALSILLPTHRTSPDNRQDPIQVKNLVEAAKERLLKEFSAREIQPLFQRLDDLVDEIAYNYTLDGLALYVSHDFGKLFYLPFHVPSRIVIDQTFLTRDLVYGLHRAQRYWVLLLSQGAARLLAGTGETLEEVRDRNFPMQMQGPGATGPLPYHADSRYLDDRIRRYCQQVDRAFAPYAEDEELPLVVGGVDRQISFFREVSLHAAAIAGTITGNFDRITIPELVPQVWPIVQSARQAQQADALKALARAVDGQAFVSTIGEAWRLAQEGRGRLLVVENGYHVPAVLAENGHLELVADKGGSDVMDDAVDEVMEAVLEKGGQVALVDDGTLAAHQRIALILRY